ncbi:CinA family nicotinamide mononucleotide deamidase-related protein [Halioxenophilus aromaticivorans]|uniref:CinA-like protein n=1 Tax=Halioxenophilus aromaticivorans TaxID=1306992 RepID=A0AAV3U4C0_9ALTE
MKIEMICTGEEVLSGQIVDTNAAWFGDVLMQHGIEMQRRITVGDRLQDLIDVFVERSHHADIILVNGGLGPTSDDMSAEAMAKAKGEPLAENKAWREHMEGWYEKNNRPMHASNLKQAMLPQSAVMVHNPVGTACGFRVELNGAWLFFTPGVPREFKTMVYEQFLPFVHELFPQAQATKLIKWLTFGAGESALAHELDALCVPADITVGYRTSLPHVEIKLLARGEQAIAALPEFTQQVKQAIGHYVVSQRFSTLAQEVHALLTERDTTTTLSLAESCTGGMVASRLIDFPGSSQYLAQGIVAYNNTAKMDLLGVKPTTLQQYGAVSLQCVSEMAEGARSRLDTDFGLAISGIAGPDGGTEDKPVGTVALALVSRTQTWSQVVKAPLRGRTQIRQVSCAVALDMLRRALLGENPIADYGFIERLN